MTLEEKAQLFEALCTLVESLDLDGITLAEFGRREKISENLIRDEIGVVSRPSEHGSPYPVDGPIKDAFDLKTFKMKTRESFLQSPPTSKRYLAFLGNEQVLIRFFPH